MTVNIFIDIAFYIVHRINLILQYLTLKIDTIDDDFYSNCFLLHAICMLNGQRPLEKTDHVIGAEESDIFFCNRKRLRVMINTKFMEQK